MERYTFSNKTEAFEFLETIKQNYLYLDYRRHSPYPDYVSLHESEIYTLYIYSGGYRPGSIFLGYFQNGQFVSV